MSKEVLEMYLTHALHYIAYLEGGIDDYLFSYDLYDDFYEEGWNEFFGFNDRGEEE